MECNPKLYHLTTVGMVFEFKSCWGCSFLGVVMKGTRRSNTWFTHKPWHKHFRLYSQKPHSVKLDLLTHQFLGHIKCYSLLWMPRTTLFELPLFLVRGFSLFQILVELLKLDLATAHFLSSITDHILKLPVSSPSSQCHSSCTGFRFVLFRMSINV